MLCSQQQLVSCTMVSPYNNLGCNGGWMFNSWSYLKSNGLMKLSDYPYTSGSNGLVRPIPVVSLKCLGHIAGQDSHAAQYNCHTVTS